MQTKSEANNKNVHGNEETTKNAKNGENSSSAQQSHVEKYNFFTIQNQLNKLSSKR